MLFYIGAQNT